MRTFLNKGLWVSLYLLFPVTMVGLFSQNAIPGEFLYPVKLGMENVGAFVFSLTPQAKASYDSTLTERRFEEAQKLITYESNTSGLDTLVAQATKTQESVSNIQDQKQKVELQTKLINDIDKYQEKLTQTQQKVDPTYIPPTPTPTSTLPVIKKRDTPPAVFPTKQPQPLRHTPLPNPNISTTAPTPQVQPITPPDIVNNIEETKHKLEEIKEQVQFQSMQMQSEMKTTTTTQQSPTPSPFLPTATPVVRPTITYSQSPTITIPSTLPQSFFAPQLSPSPEVGDQSPGHSGEKHGSSKPPGHLDDH